MSAQMEILGTLISILLLVAILITPVICVLKNCNFVKLHLVSLPIIFSLLLLSAYWPQFFAELRLDLMGFNFEGMSDQERVENVSPNMRAEATNLYWFNMGIGWPLKAALWMVICLPYPFIIWLVRKCYITTKSRLTSNGT